MGTAPMPDYYEILGVERDATPAEIRTAWRSVTRTAHPDAGGSAGLFRLVMEASEVLLDPARRADYDAGGGGGNDSNPEEWSTESDDGGYYEDDDSEWQDVEPQPQRAPAPGEYGPAHAEPGSYHGFALRLLLGIVAVTIIVAALVASSIVSPWYMAGVVALDTVGVAVVCPRRWERVVVAIVALIVLGELATIRVGDRGAHMVPMQAIPAGAIATGVAVWVSHRRRS
jgi:hypothetical protein